VRSIQNSVPATKAQALTRQVRRKGRVGAVIAVAALSVAAIACGSVPARGGPASSANLNTAAPVSPSPTSTCAAPAPAAHSRAAVAYDSRRQVAVLFGGYKSGGGTLNDTWLFDGHCWQQPNTVVSPPPRVFAAVAYDPLAHKTILIGGRSETPQADYPEDAWVWDGASWSQLAGAPKFDFPVAAFDDARKVVVVFGFTAQGPETWTWDGSIWSQKTTSGSPQVSTGAAMCFDRSTQDDMLYGGFGEGVAGGVSNQTWLWNGNGWNLAQAPVSPGPRYEPILSCGRDTILFGGVTTISPPVAQASGTWKWNGTAWMELVIAHNPPECCSAISANNQQLVLDTFKDGIPVWLWTGQDWALET
jgi:hypothetical protein